jgi:hypothetical protein
MSAERSEPFAPGALSRRPLIDRCELGSRCCGIPVLAKRLALGVVARMSLTHQIFDSHLKVKLDFRVDVALDGANVEESFHCAVILMRAKRA